MSGRHRMRGRPELSALLLDGLSRPPDIPKP
jgi:hypothetical protein